MLIWTSPWEGVSDMSSLEKTPRQTQNIPDESLHFSEELVEVARERTVWACVGQCYPRDLEEDEDEDQSEMEECRKKTQH